MRLYNKSDEKREKLDLPFENQEYRTSFRRDYARLIHSACFRRLQGKTQLFPGIESDYFRNRLTHSLEVAQIAKSIAQKLNSKNEYFKKNKIKEDIVEFAGLAHDLGHPPFGHVGELALHHCMYKNGGFEGNAQTLRILSKLEKKHTSDYNNQDIIGSKGEDLRLGLNLTYRSLASILKYDSEIPYDPLAKSKQVKKGYYTSEKSLVNSIKINILGLKDENSISKELGKKKFKTIECQIMDIADDIAYSIFDLEDAFKGNFITPLTFLIASDEILQDVCKRVNNAMKKNGYVTSDNVYKVEHIKEVLNNFFTKFVNYGEIKKSLENDQEIIKITENSVNYITSIVAETCHRLTHNGYFRIAFTSDLVNEAIEAIEVIPDEKFPCLSKVKINKGIREQIEVLKNFTYVYLIKSPLLKVPEYRGYEIVKTIFETITGKAREGHNLMPSDYRNLYNTISPQEKHRVACDFIAGMTDRYAIEFYGRITSEHPQTIFKPF